jgi:hypothetical protein
MPEPLGTPAAAEPPEPWGLRTGLSISVWLLAIVATVLAATGQIQFAHWAGITDVRAYAVPAVLELVAVAFLLIGYRRARRGDSPGALWLLAAAVGGFAVYTNVAHSGRAGLVYGAASAITLILWFVKLRDDYRHFQRQTGQATRPRPKLGALWLVAPRLSARAWIVAARRRISTVDEAVAYAEVWRAVFEDSRSARVRRGLARRTAWRSVAEASGGVWAELPRTAEVAAVDVVQRSMPASPAGAAAVAPRGADAPAGTATPPGSGTYSSKAAAPAPPEPAMAPYSAHVDGHVGTASRGDDVVRALPGARLGDHRPLSAQVHAFLESQVNPNDHAGLDETDDPYLAWTTARALNVDVEEIADDVRSWRRGVSSRMRQATVTQPRPLANGAHR